MQQNSRNPYLCLTIVWFLGMLAILSLLGIIVLGVVGKEPSPALISIASGSMCALASFLVMPPRGSMGYGQPAPPPSPPSPQQSQQLIVSPAQGEVVSPATGTGCPPREGTATPH